MRIFFATLFAALLMSGANAGTPDKKSVVPKEQLQKGLLQKGNAMLDLKTFRTTTAGECMKAAMAYGAYGMENDFAIITITPIDEETQDFTKGCIAKYGR